LITDFDLHIKDTLSSNPTQTKKEENKLQAFKEHFDALRKHVDNT
jgi:hypothetical protein